MVHQGLWQQLIGLDCQQTAKRAQCQYFSSPQRYVVTLLNTEYVVNLEDEQIFSLKPGSPPVPAEFLEQLCILAYLINAKDLPIVNKLVRAETLPTGQFFFRGPHKLPTETLEKVFGPSPELLYQNTELFTAEKCEFGDASIQFYILPRVPVTIVIWRADEEFDARASILFDRTAGEHLPLDALSAGVNLAVEALVQAVSETG